MEFKNAFFAFEFQMVNSTRLIISPYSLQEFHEILITNNTFSSQFNKWTNFRMICGDVLENHPQYIEYKKSLKNEIENSTNRLIAKLVNMII